VSDEHRLEMLLSAQELMAKYQGDSVPQNTRAEAECQFLACCVAAILHRSGRAQFPDALDLARGGFSAKPTSNSEFVILHGGALYRFDRGEFPTYDEAYDRANGSDKQLAMAIGRSADFDDQVQAMLNRALASLGVPRAEKKQ
jgi:hypothetical protein